MKQFKIENFKENEVIRATINYLNNDYAPSFSKKQFVKSEENLSTIKITFILPVNKNLIQNKSELIEKIKHAFIETDLFDYEVFFESTEDVDLTEQQSIYKLECLCKGLVFTKKKRQIVTQSAKLKIDTVKSVFVDLIIKNANGNLSINHLKFKNLLPTEVIEIDAKKSKVKGIPNEKWDFYEFLKSDKNELDLTIEGNAQIELIYRGQL